MFFVNSRAYQETGNITDPLLGGGPLIVRRDTGGVRTFGSAYSLEPYEVGTIPYDTRVDTEDDATS